MSDHEHPGVRELGLARRAAACAVVLVLLAQVSSGLTSRVGLSLTFVLWLFAILAGTQAAVAAVIGVWRRRHSWP
ncbi:hypothetical protein [Aeromicrobium sp. CF3.5]|uniref:hypothetical protein n=1 Tax=Aeromicrobium sp. CF3.5 TaxID=3373078 RepID=UPI003EE5C97E